jgi:hypothetical protein
MHYHHISYTILSHIFMQLLMGVSLCSCQNHVYIVVVFVRLINNNSDSISVVIPDYQEWQWQDRVEAHC